MLGACTYTTCTCTAHDLQLHASNHVYMAYLLLHAFCQPECVLCSYLFMAVPSLWARWSSGLNTALFMLVPGIT